MPPFLSLNILVASILVRAWTKKLGKYNITVAAIALGIMEVTGLRMDAYNEALSYSPISSAEAE
jgi:hypothetical protein